MDKKCNVDKKESRSRKGRPISIATTSTSTSNATFESTIDLILDLELKRQKGGNRENVIQNLVRNESESTIEQSDGTATYCTYPHVLQEVASFLADSETSEAERTNKVPVESVLISVPLLEVLRSKKLPEFLTLPEDNRVNEINEYCENYFRNKYKQKSSSQPCARPQSGDYFKELNVENKKFKILPIALEMCLHGYAEDKPDKVTLNTFWTKDTGDYYELHQCKPNDASSQMSKNSVDENLDSQNKLIKNYNEYFSRGSDNVLRINATNSSAIIYVPTQKNESAVNDKLTSDRLTNTTGKDELCQYDPHDIDNRDLSKDPFAKNESSQQEYNKNYLEDISKVPSFVLDVNMETSKMKSSEMENMSNLFKRERLLEDLYFNNYYIKGSATNSFDEQEYNESYQEDISRVPEYVLEVNMGTSSKISSETEKMSELVKRERILENIYFNNYYGSGSAANIFSNESHQNGLTNFSQCSSASHTCDRCPEKSDDLYRQGCSQEVGDVFQEIWQEEEPNRKYIYDSNSSFLRKSLEMDNLVTFKRMCYPGNNKNSFVQETLECATVNSDKEQLLTKQYETSDELSVQSTPDRSEQKQLKVLFTGKLLEEPSEDSCTSTETDTKLFNRERTPGARVTFGNSDELKESSETPKRCYTPLGDNSKIKTPLKLANDYNTNREMSESQISDFDYFLKINNEDDKNIDSNDSRDFNDVESLDVKCIVKSLLFKNEVIAIVKEFLKENVIMSKMNCDTYDTYIIPNFDKSLSKFDDLETNENCTEREGTSACKWNDVTCSKEYINSNSNTCYISSRCEVSRWRSLILKKRTRSNASHFYLRLLRSNTLQNKTGYLNKLLYRQSLPSFNLKSLCNLSNRSKYKERQSFWKYRNAKERRENSDTSNLIFHTSFSGNNEFTTDHFRIPNQTTNDDITSATTSTSRVVGEHKKSKVILELNKFKEVLNEVEMRQNGLLDMFNYDPCGLFFKFPDQSVVK